VREGGLRAMRILRVIGAVLVAVATVVGGVVAFLTWRGVKPKDLRMTWHWLWLALALALLTCGAGSFRLLVKYVREDIVVARQRKAERIAAARAVRTEMERRYFGLLERMFKRR
jgi:uncharacterized membrane protein